MNQAASVEPVSTTPAEEPRYGADWYLPYLNDPPLRMLSSTVDEITRAFCEFNAFPCVPEVDNFDHYRAILVEMLDDPNQQYPNNWNTSLGGFVAAWLQRDTAYTLKAPRLFGLRRIMRRYTRPCGEMFRDVAYHFPEEVERLLGAIPMTAPVKAECVRALRWAREQGYPCPRAVMVELLVKYLDDPEEVVQEAALEVLDVLRDNRSYAVIKALFAYQRDPSKPDRLQGAARSIMGFDVPVVPATP